MKHPVAAVELDPLLQAAGWALAFGGGVTLVFALGIRALIAASENRRRGHHVSAAVAAAAGALCLVAVAVAVVFGLVEVSDGAGA